MGTAWGFWQLWGERGVKGWQRESSFVAARLGQELLRDVWSSGGDMCCMRAAKKVAKAYQWL